MRSRYRAAPRARPCGSCSERRRAVLARLRTGDFGDAKMRLDLRQLGWTRKASPSPNCLRATRFASHLASKQRGAGFADNPGISVARRLPHLRPLRGLGAGRRFQGCLRRSAPGFAPNSRHPNPLPHARRGRRAWGPGGIGMVTVGSPKRSPPLAVDGDPGPLATKGHGSPPAPPRTADRGPPRDRRTRSPLPRC